MNFIREGVSELKIAPELSDGYILTINSLLLSEIEEKQRNEYSLDRTSLAGTEDIVILGYC